MELGVDQDESIRIYLEFRKIESKATAECDKRRNEAINGILPENARNILWKLIGRDFQPDLGGGNLAEINVLLNILLRR